MSKRSSMRSEKIPRDVPIAEGKSASQNNPYVFTRAFARLLGLDKEQAVNGYLAAISPAEPKPTPPESVPPRNATSDSSPGRPITQSEVEIRKVAEIPNPANKKPPAGVQIHAPVTESAPAEKGSDRATGIPYAKAPSDLNPRRPITESGVNIGRATQKIPGFSMKKPPAGAQIVGRVTESAPAQGGSDRAASLPHMNAPSDSNPGRPITGKGFKSRKVTEIPGFAIKKFPAGAQSPTRVSEPVLAPGESDRTSNLLNTNAPSGSSPARPDTQSQVEIRKVTEIPNSSNIKLPAGAQSQARVPEPVPAAGEGNHATSLPHTKAPSDSSLGRPVTQSEFESRKVAEFPNSGSKKLPQCVQIEARVSESVPSLGESDRTTKLPHTQAPSDSSFGRPLTQGEGEIRKVAEVSNPANKQLPECVRLEARVSKPVPAPRESDRATKLPNTNEPPNSSPARPMVQREVEIRKVAEIPNPSKKKLPVIAKIEARVSEPMPAPGESDQATKLPHANEAPNSSPARPVTQGEVESRKVAGIPHPANMKLPAGAKIKVWVTRSAQAQGKSDRTTSPPWETLAILLLVVALSFAVWGFYTREVKRPIPPNSNPSASISLPAPFASSHSQEPSPKGQTAPSGMSGDSAAHPPSSRAAFTVRIRARKNVWISIRADGRKLTEETLTGGAEKTVMAAKQIVVKTANLGALDLEFNGQKLPSQGARGEVQTLEFGPSGLEVIISKAPTRIKPGM